MKAILGEFQHALVIADIDKRKIRKVVKKTCAERRKITLLIDVKIRKRFEEKVTKLVDVGAPNRRSNGDTWLLLLLLARLVNRYDVVFDEWIKFGSFGCRQCR